MTSPLSSSATVSFKELVASLVVLSDEDFAAVLDAPARPMLVSVKTVPRIQ